MTGYHACGIGWVGVRVGGSAGRLVCGGRVVCVCVCVGGGGGLGGGWVGEGWVGVCGCVGVCVCARAWPLPPPLRPPAPQSLRAPDSI